MSFDHAACPVLRLMVAWALLVASLSGCGDSHPATYPVRGMVRFRSGEPVRAGRIETKPADSAAQARGEISEDGSFTLSTWAPGDGAVAGSHKVVISQMVLMEDVKIVGGAHAPHDDAPSLVHPRHARYSTSDLSITVEPTEGNTPVLIVESATSVSSAK